MLETINISDFKENKELESFIKIINFWRLHSPMSIPQSFSVTKESLEFLKIDKQEQIIHFKLSGLKGKTFEIPSFIPIDDIKNKTIGYTQKILEESNVVDLGDYRVEKPKELKETAIFCLKDLFGEDIFIDFSEIKILREEKNRLYFIYNEKKYDIETINIEVFQLIRNTFPKEIRKGYGKTTKNLFKIEDIKFVDPGTGEKYFIEFFYEGIFYRAITKTYEELNEIGKEVSIGLRRKKFKIISSKK